VYALVVLAGVAAAAAGFALWWRKRGAGQEGAQTGSSAQKPGAKGLDAELDAFDAGARSNRSKRLRPQRLWVAFGRTRRCVGSAVGLILLVDTARFGMLHCSSQG
jgi:hypothetical protein